MSDRVFLGGWNCSGPRNRLAAWLMAAHVHGRVDRETAIVDHHAPCTETIACRMPATIPLRAARRRRAQRIRGGAQARARGHRLEETLRALPQWPARVIGQGEVQAE